MRRREFLDAAGRALLVAPVCAAAPRAGQGARATIGARLAAIERRVAGRLGVAVLDLRARRTAGHREHERFPMCSTFKLLLAGLALTRVDGAREDLERIVRYDSTDLLEWAPITRQHVTEGGMSVAALIAAALEYSDNTAANLLLDSSGGPPALTAFARRLGDAVTRLDRREPDLNSAIPGDPRDTTTPAAMLGDMRRLLLGDVLGAASRERLLGWLRGNATGDAKLRAGLPRSWTVGDKTGNGQHGSMNDVAIIWPGRSEPILVTAYLTGTDASSAERDAALADVGRAVAAWVG